MFFWLFYPNTRHFMMVAVLLCVHIVIIFFSMLCELMNMDDQMLTCLPLFITCSVATSCTTGSNSIEREPRLLD